MKNNGGKYKEQPRTEGGTFCPGSRRVAKTAIAVKLFQDQYEKVNPMADKSEFIRQAVQEKLEREGLL